MPGAYPSVTDGTTARRLRQRSGPESETDRRFEIDGGQVLSPHHIHLDEKTTSPEYRAHCATAKWQTVARDACATADCSVVAESHASRCALAHARSVPRPSSMEMRSSVLPCHQAFEAVPLSWDAVTQILYGTVEGTVHVRSGIDVRFSADVGLEAIDVLSHVLD